MNIKEQKTFLEIEKLLEVFQQDLKKPLTSLSFNIETIKRILSDENKIDHIEISKKIECIEIKTKSMIHTIQNLIDLTQTQLSEIPLKKNLTHTHDLIYNAVQLARMKSGEDMVLLEGHLQNEYGTVACDKDRLIQVFTDVIHSLVELTPARSAVKLSTKIKGEVAQFFFKADNWASPQNLLEAPRTSLGLALCKWIVEAHKGSILFESKEKLGTIFTIELPTAELQQMKVPI